MQTACSGIATWQVLQPDIVALATLLLHVALPASCRPQATELLAEDFSEEHPLHTLAAPALDRCAVHSTRARCTVLGVLAQSISERQAELRLSELSPMLHLFLTVLARGPCPGAGAALRQMHEACSNLLAHPLPLGLLAQSTIRALSVELQAPGQLHRQWVLCSVAPPPPKSSALLQQHVCVLGSSAVPAEEPGARSGHWTVGSLQQGLRGELPEAQVAAHLLHACLGAAGEDEDEDEGDPPAVGALAQLRMTQLRQLCQQAQPAIAAIESGADIPAQVEVLAGVLSSAKAMVAAQRARGRQQGTTTVILPVALDCTEVALVQDSVDGEACLLSTARHEVALHATGARAAFRYPHTHFMQPLKHIFEQHFGSEALADEPTPLQLVLLGDNRTVGEFLCAFVANLKSSQHWARLSPLVHVVLGPAARPEHCRLACALAAHDPWYQRHVLAAAGDNAARSPAAMWSKLASSAENATAGEYVAAATPCLPWATDCLLRDASYTWALPVHDCEVRPATQSCCCLPWCTSLHWPAERLACWQMWSLPCTDCQCTACTEGSRLDAPAQRHFGTYRMVPFALELRVLLLEPAHLHLAYTTMSPVLPCLSQCQSIPDYTECGGVLRCAGGCCRADPLL